MNDTLMCCVCNQRFAPTQMFAGVGEAAGVEYCGGCLAMAMRHSAIAPTAIFAGSATALQALCVAVAGMVGEGAGAPNAGAIAPPPPSTGAIAPPPMPSMGAGNAPTPPSAPPNALPSAPNGLGYATPNGLPSAPSMGAAVGAPMPYGQAYAVSRAAVKPRRRQAAPYAQPSAAGCKAARALASGVKREIPAKYGLCIDCKASAPNCAVCGQAPVGWDGKKSAWFARCYNCNQALWRAA